MCNWSVFGLKFSLLASGQTGAKAQPDRDITKGKSQGGLSFRNEESGQKLTSYGEFIYFALTGRIAKSCYEQ